MKAIEKILEDNIIERHNGDSDYLACCGGLHEFGESHHTDTCALIMARKEYTELMSRIDDLHREINILKVKNYRLRSMKNK